MTAPVWETLNLSSENTVHLLDALALIPETKISPEARKIREEFRKIMLYRCINTYPLIIAFVDFVAGRIQIEDEDIQYLKQDLQDRYGENFVSSIIAMMQIIREELISK